MLIHQGWFTALYTQHLLDSQSLEFEICIFSREAIPVTLLPPPRRLAPSLSLGTTWVRQLRSGSCHHPTAATKCNEQPSQATANPVGGKACSSTKGGLLRYMPNTYLIHKVSNLKFAYFQGRLSPLQYVQAVYQHNQAYLSLHSPYIYRFSIKVKGRLLYFRIMF